MNKKVLSIVAIIALVAVLGICLVACNADSYTKKLEKAGYSVTVMDKDSDGYDEANEFMIKSGYEGGVSWAIVAYKAGFSLTSGVDAGAIEITKFKKTADAKKYVEDLGGESDMLVIKGSIVFEGDKDSIAVVA